jgi:hypothetical protein
MPYVIRRGGDGASEAPIDVLVSSCLSRRAVCEVDVVNPDV